MKRILYGMLGFGHSPGDILESMKQRYVMANIVTPSLAQKTLAELLRKEIGHTRDGCPFERFVCMNSGSEAVTVGARISDINAKLMTDPGGRHANKTIRLLGLTLSNLGMYDTQLPLFPRDDKLHETVDAIRSKYGFDALRLAEGRD